MPSCCILQCNARKNIKQPELTLHRFPVNEDLKKQWLEAIGTHNINPNHKTWYVCSLHFETSCFNKTHDATRLWEGAIPSLNLQPSSYIKYDDSKVADKNVVEVWVERMCSEPTDQNQLIKSEDNWNITAPVEKNKLQNKTIVNLTKKCNFLKAKVKKLNEQVRRRDKKIAQLTVIVKDLLLTIQK